MGTIAIIGAGPYGLSLAAHLAAQNVEHRIFGRPMLFWSQIADAGGDRYLKSYCFGTDLSTPRPGFAFADYSKPRGLETFEPCSIKDFAQYGLWFQKANVPWVEPAEAENIAKFGDSFVISLTSGEQFVASQIILATGLSHFAYVPPMLASLSHGLVTHTSMIKSFASFRGCEVAVIGAGQSALEAAGLLHEAGARPQLLVRKNLIIWNKRVEQERGVWQRLRSPISGLGTGPKAWALTHLPGWMHRAPTAWRTRFVESHLPPEGAWWLRARVEKKFPIHFETAILGACERAGRVVLRLAVGEARKECCISVDHVIAGTGYDIDIKRITYLDSKLCNAMELISRAPRLNANFESSISGLRFIGPASAMSFGPLFRFVIGAKYTARVTSEELGKVHWRS